MYSCPWEVVITGPELNGLKRRVEWGLLDGGYPIRDKKCPNCGAVMVP